MYGHMNVKLMSSDTIQPRNQSCIQ